MTQCGTCKAPVVWIRLATGKAMICEAEVVVFVEGGGHETMFTTSGTTYTKCRTGAFVTPADVGHRRRGHRPHWPSCPDANQHRKK